MVKLFKPCGVGPALIDKCMIFSVFGTPSPLTSFVLHAARAATRIVVGPYDAIAASTVADLEERWTYVVYRSLLVSRSSSSLLLTPGGQGWED
jgi:hypothetical protein